MRTIRTVMDFVILESLWEIVNAYASKTAKVKTSRLFEESGKGLLEEPKPLAIEPNRRVTVSTRKKMFDNEFPMIRNSLYIDATLLQELYRIYENMAKEQYGENVKLNTNALVHTVFYYFCINNKLPVNKKYFDDDYFKAKYTFSDERNFESFRQLRDILGKVPTSREWRKHRNDVDGPSESYILNKYGTFTSFKESALGINEEENSN